jgi:hypothetical protein
MECIISQSPNNHLRNFMVAAEQYLLNHDESSLNTILYILQVCKNNFKFMFLVLHVLDYQDNVVFVFINK